MTSRHRPIVAVAVDLGPGSEEVARAGASIAQALAGQAVLLHSIAAPTVASYDRVVSRLTILSRLHDDMPFEVLSGPPALSIHDWVEAVDAAVIVVAARRPANRIERSFATIDGLLRNSSRLLWVVRPGQPFPPSRPLFAVDSSESSSLAVLAGNDHLNRLGWSREPVLVTAVDEAPARSEAHARLRRLSERAHLEKPGLRLALGAPLNAIERQLVADRCDVLVAGSSVPRGWNRLRFGSVASELAYRASCHVLLIPEPAARCYQAAHTERTESSEPPAALPPTDTVALHR